jgi:hypothetical protein
MQEIIKGNNFGMKINKRLITIKKYNFDSIKLKLQIV